MKKLLFAIIICISLASCSENYSNGERIGMITQFSKTGVLWKSREGHLNVTQTGMNSSIPFDFSIDNDKEDTTVINKLDSAANYGWKVKLVYHETFGKNWFHNRGSTDHFVIDCHILDRTMVNNSTQHVSNTSIHDTIYVVIRPN